MSISNQDNIRNFSIIAHIDHGKSTLADRFIQLCGGLTDREMSAQVLDSMDIERERGITIKAQSVNLHYTAKDGITYELNLIDTPGHVDFTYEVSRSLAACEGALLVVDAAQGVEAQTLANCYTAIDYDLEVIPVFNKIDLPAAEPERVALEVEEVIGLDSSSRLFTSAKAGIGIEEVLEAVVKLIPPPEGDRELPLKAMIMDSWFDNYLGTVSLVKVLEGHITKGQKIKMMSNKQEFLVDEVGVFNPKKTEKVDGLHAGDVGYVIAGIKDVRSARVGDTITDAKKPTAEACEGFKATKPSVYAGLYPIDSAQFEDFRDALQKLSLNDASLKFEPESSSALGFGFRCGFLGMLHMEIIQERIEREYRIDLITTAPTVVYEVVMHNDTIKLIDNPSQMPDPGKFKEIREPFIDVHIISPHEYIGAIMQMCMDRRGVQKNMQYHGNQVLLDFELPMSEVVMDFFDKLKSASRGYASLDYDYLETRPADMVKVDVLINGETVDPLAILVHRSQSQFKGRVLVKKMQELIPRQMFDIAIQAAIGSKIIARETVKAMRKNVTAKCYGGDITRKKKLLEKQKEGKRKMKSIGSVEIPQEAFMAVLKVDD